MFAPCARYCSVGCAASPSSVTRPCGPVGHRLAVVQNPVPVARDVAQHVAHPGIGAREHLVQLVRAAEVLLAAAEAPAGDGRDVVHHRAAAQAVLHQVQVGADPDRHRIEVAAVDDLVGRHHPAVGHVARHARRAVGHDRRARRRPQAVGADQRRALVLGAVLAAHDHRIAALLEACQAARSFERDLLAPLARLEYFSVQVAPVYDEVTVLVALEELSAERDPRDLPVVEGVDQDQRVGENRVRLERLQHAQAVEHAAHVRPHLDAVADLAELRRLFQHAHPPALAGEGERRRQPADAAAGDQDGQVIHGSKAGLAADGRRSSAAKNVCNRSARQRAAGRRNRAR